MTVDSDKVTSDIKLGTLNPKPETFNFMDFSFEHVYQVVRLVPDGRVTTYGAIARYLGSAQSARMVGWAMNSSKLHEEPVPAHRVVNHAGMLTGKDFFGESIMQQLLEAEGIKVRNDKIVDFDEVFWDPNIELGGG